VGAGRLSKRPTEPARAEPGVEAESRPAPAWAGDVGLGVQAWVGGSRPTPEPPRDSGAEGPEADHEAVARKILLAALTGQARSRRELADRLAKRGVPDDLAGRLLDRFTEVGLIDDVAFARLWVESRRRSRGLAPRALAQELRRKGVADEVARGALDQLESDELEETARGLVRKKLRSLERFDEATKTRRLVGMLARKGYSPGLAFALVKEQLALDDTAEDHP